MSLVAAIICLICFGIIVVIQIALAFGAPWGKVAWGGRFEGKLPTTYRIMSGLTLPVFAFSTLVVLDRGGITAIFPQVSRIVVWVLAAYLTLNSIMNLISKSHYERFIAGTLSIASAICLYILAI